MSNSSVTSFKVYPFGFSAFEKSTIETFFRLAARRAPFWTVTPRIDDASVVLLTAATREDVDACRPKLTAGQKVVIVGSSDFGTGWPVLPRPLRLTAILTSLGEFVQPSDVAATATVAPATVAPIPTVAAPVAPPRAIQPSVATAQQPPSPVPAAAVRPAPAAAVEPPQRPASNPFARAASATPTITPARAPISAPVAARAPAPVAAPAVAVAAASSISSGNAANVLIVDDSDIALKFMHSRLKHFGYESQLARSGEEALALVEQHDFQFVFLDVMMAGLDGYQTCRAIKLNKGKRATVPVVVMLTSRGGTVDKIRGSMSGCDAFLTKPLNEQQLAMVLAKHAASGLKARAPGR